MVTTISKLRTVLPDGGDSPSDKRVSNNSDVAIIGFVNAYTVDGR
jgi:hypothetical protein